MEDELFFVGIRDPIDLRKELLNSSKNLIDSLKRYEAYKDIKEEKLMHIMELKRVFDELLVLNKKLRNKLPHIPVKAAPTLARETREIPTKQSKLPRSKIDVLEEELSKIEERLGTLE